MQRWAAQRSGSAVGSGAGVGALLPGWLEVGAELDQSRAAEAGQLRGEPIHQVERGYELGDDAQLRRSSGLKLEESEPPELLWSEPSLPEPASP